MNITPPKSWKKPDNHIHVLLQSPWYKIMVRLYKSIFEATNEFYRQEQIFPMMFPITTGAISSPMGKGSATSNITSKPLPGRKRPLYRKSFLFADFWNFAIYRG